MTYLLSFFVCGFICAIGQIIYDNTKFTPGHITSLFVVIGSFLDLFGIYDKLLEISRVGASLPITSFGHSLMHAANQAMLNGKGIIGVASGLFDMTSTGITSAILFAFLTAVIFKPKS
jgi:stage V sporulation protein AE